MRAHECERCERKLCERERYTYELCKCERRAFACDSEVAVSMCCGRFSRRDTTQCDMTRHDTTGHDMTRHDMM